MAAGCPPRRMGGARDCSRCFVGEACAGGSGSSEEHARASPGGKQRRQAAALHMSCLDGRSRQMGCVAPRSVAGHEVSCPYASRSFVLADSISRMRVIWCHERRRCGGATGRMRGADWRASSRGRLIPQARLISRARLTVDPEALLCVDLGAPSGSTGRGAPVESDLSDSWRRAEGPFVPA